VRGNNVPPLACAGAASNIATTIFRRHDDLAAVQKEGFHAKFVNCLTFFDVTHADKRKILDQSYEIIHVDMSGTDPASASALENQSRAMGIQKHYVNSIANNSGRA
jgi:hypothetical protein